MLQLPVLVFSVIFHEFAHGFAAYRRGDDTAYLSGRLTFNPLPHVDPLGTVILPAACVMLGLPTIGWARPVPVNPYRMRNPRSDMAMVAFSGPLSNLVLVAAAALAFKAVAALGGGDLALTLLRMAGFAIVINLALAVFNLIPLYPLDGGQIMLGLLKGRALEAYEKHIPYGIYIIFALVLLGLIKYIIFPPLLLALSLLGSLGIYVGL